MKMSVGGVGIEGGGSGKTLELSPYDQQRRAHKAITDSTEIVISPRSLASELCCPICLDLLTNTMTTKECLHRFCSDCITTALLRGNKECPTCRKKLVSKRSLRADPNFDALISKIWPDRKEYEAMQERARQRFNRQSSVEALSKSIEAGIRAQAQHRRQRVQGSYEYEKRKRRPKQPENADRPASDGESASEFAATSSAMDDDQAEIELILHPHPDLEKRADVADYVKQPRYLKTTSNATIDHLNKYLSMRIVLDGEEAACMETNDRPPPPTVARDSPDLQCSISVLTTGKEPTNGSHVLLDGDATLMDVRTRHWPQKKPLQLDFQLGNPPPK